MGSFHVWLHLFQLVVPPEEINEFSENRVVVRLLREDLLELLDGLLVLV